MPASRHAVHVSRPTFTPGPGCTYRPIYALAKRFAASLTEDDGDLLRPPMIPAESVEEALAAGYILIDRDLLDTESDGDSYVALLARDLYRTCAEVVLGQHCSFVELTAAQTAMQEAKLRHAACIDPEAEPSLFQAVEQAETHFDLVGWDALVRHGITTLPSLLFAFLTTDDPGFAVKAQA